MFENNKKLHDFWYGKPHGERRLGELYEDKTGLYKHREWRGVEDTFFYFNHWLRMYGKMGVMVAGAPVSVLKGLWRYRWMGNVYLSALAWFDRGLEGLHGPALRASAYHYEAMLVETCRQLQTQFKADANLRGGKRNDKWFTTFANDETVCGHIFYPWRDRADNIPVQLSPYFLTAHVQCNAVLHYIDAAEGRGLPSDPCPMCAAEAGIAAMDDYPSFSPFLITSNEACDGSVGTSVWQDWYFNKPLFAMPQPMRFDDPDVQKYCQDEIRSAWKFIEDMTGMPFSWEQLKMRMERYNELTEFEREKWDVAANTPYYPINSVAQALYRIYYGQVGDRDIWHKTDARVRKIMEKCVREKTVTFPQTRHRAIAWSCAPLFYSYWCTWAYNCWGINTIINMDSLMFDKIMRTDTLDNAVEDLAVMHEWAPMRRNAVGGYEHIFMLWENMERFNCDMVIMYDQLACKGMQGIHGMFEDEFRRRNIHAIWVPHELPDRRTVSRAEIRHAISDYMTTVMHEEPLDPSLLEFDDSEGW